MTSARLSVDDFVRLPKTAGGIRAETADDDYFCGVPAIVIEVLAPSNSAAEMLEREEICLRHGGQEVWMVDPQRQSVKVVRAGGRSSLYDATSTINSSALGGSINVNDIFKG